MWGTGPFYVLAGIGTGKLHKRLFPLVALSLALGGWASLAPYYGADTKPRWDLAAAYLAVNTRPGDVIVTDNGMTSFVLGAYFQRYHGDPNTLRVRTERRRH